MLNAGLSFIIRFGFSFVVFVKSAFIFLAKFSNISFHYLFLIVDETCCKSVEGISLRVTLLFAEEDFHPFF